MYNLTEQTVVALQGSITTTVYNIEPSKSWARKGIILYREDEWPVYQRDQETEWYLGTTSLSVPVPLHEAGNLHLQTHFYHARGGTNPLPTTTKLQAECERLRQELAQERAALRFYQDRCALLARLIQITRNGLQHKVDGYTPYDEVDAEEVTHLTGGIQLAVERLDRAHAYCDPAEPVKIDHSQIEANKPLWDEATGDRNTEGDVPQTANREHPSLLLSSGDANTFYKAMQAVIDQQEEEYRLLCEQNDQEGVAIPAHELAEARDAVTQVTATVDKGRRIYRRIVE